MGGTTAQPGALDDVIAWRDGRIVAIDQTVLPHELRLLDITTVDGALEIEIRGKRDMLSIRTVASASDLSARAVPLAAVEPAATV